MASGLLEEKPADKCACQVLQNLFHALPHIGPERLWQETTSAGKQVQPSRPRPTTLRPGDQYFKSVIIFLAALAPRN